MGKVSEWFWRFPAAVMMLAVGWSMWIFYQLNPPPLVNVDKLRLSDTITAPDPGTADRK